MAGLSVDNVLALRQSILQRNSALQDVSKSVSSGAPAGAGNADFTSALKSALNEVNTPLRRWSRSRPRPRSRASAVMNCPASGLLAVLCIP